MITDAIWRTAIRNEDNHKIKVRLIEIAQDAEKLGFSPPMTGNFSFFNRKDELIFITPSQHDRFFMEPEDIIVVSPDGGIIDNPNNRVPSMELGMHLNIYRVREDIDTIYHVHNLDLAFHRGNSEFTSVPCFEPGSEELARSVIEPMKRYDVCLLCNHGWVVIGRGLDETFKLLNTL